MHFFGTKYYRQIVVEYDIVKSNQSGTYVPGTSYKVYSQDFQTVFGDRDIYGYNEVQRVFF